MFAFQISDIGIISSEMGVSDLAHFEHFEHFPRQDHIMPLIAPLWADFGSISTLYRATDDPHTLQLVRDMIGSRNPELSGYQPGFAVVVTMEDVEITFHQHLDVRGRCTIEL